MSATRDIAPMQQRLAAPGRVGQGTAVEQSRAVAEVQAAVVVAQQCPRDIQAAQREMRQSCAQKGLADRAFYSYRRGGSTVNGPSVHMARELARCWGNVQYGIVELRRDDEYHQSEMQAWAWDVQTNSRSSTTFIVPHKRDVSGGPKALTDMRDIYENNANMGARRLREVIFSILPPWFVEEAKELTHKTLTDGGGKALPQRIADAVAMFEGLGVTADQLVTRVGRPAAKWTEYDVAQLGITFNSLRRGELRVEEEFPPPRVSTEEIVGKTAKTKASKGDQAPAAPPAAPEPPADAPPTEGDDGWPEVARPGGGS
ncbi:hypothetical protein AB0I81_22485 [Nonomuraea sp. NPDC050404]|uniref:hypothetical protein n=1 Tax=Nonomuraea sp. NPDC050404 TaxID=3155783 RepID=UPI0033F41E95